MPVSKKEKSFADVLGADPANLPNVLMLRGWLGKASEARHLRLYPVPDFALYFDIPNEAKLHEETIPNSQPKGEMLIWVKRDAEIILGQPGSLRVKDKFLVGPLANEAFATLLNSPPLPLPPGQLDLLQQLLAKWEPILTDTPRSAGHPALLKAITPMLITKKVFCLPQK